MSAAAAMSTAMARSPAASEPAGVPTGHAGVQVDGAHFAYRTRTGAVQALAGVSMRAAPHEVVAVVGPSGCGKSTLLELICALRAPDSGTVSGGPAVLMAQRDLLLPWASALDNAALPLLVAGRRRAEARRRAQPLFAELGLAGFERAMPHELSGGMRQRVAFLRTLLAGKPVLALDEPFASLDAITRAQMQEWLDRALAREPRTVVFVTHDVEEAIVLGDRVVVLSPRPGRDVATLEVPLARPRQRTHPEAIELRERALAALS